MKKFKIFAGLGGSFGGASHVKTIECTDEEWALEIAREEACQIYDSHAGLHGLSDIAEIIEENKDLSEEEAEDMYYEEMDSWLDYKIEEVKDGS